MACRTKWSPNCLGATGAEGESKKKKWPVAPSDHQMALVRRVPVAPKLGATGCPSHQHLVRQAARRTNTWCDRCPSHQNLVRQVPVAPKLGATGARRTKTWCDRLPVAPSFVRQAACRQIHPDSQFTETLEQV
ncbi:hypothetical protein WN944_018545 [Citrus x changshan-huyou]|uniref:Uncharacterized protein n=1 Tax=Citrus x changshan-huyou TaxID=2935761 RepID=A0AAP0M008_9ROSI